MTTHDLLLGLGKANLALAGGALLVMLARKPARRMFGAGLAYGLWLVPVLAAGTVLLPARQVTRTVMLPASELAPPILPVAADPVSSYIPAVQPASIDLWMLASLVWVAGLVLMIAWLALKQLQFMAEVRAGRGGPAVVGLIRPRIVTPADFEQTFTAREQTVVLAHERVHLARQDARINAFAALLRCVCWFNPIVHVAAFLMRIDQELACDAAVVADHPKARRPYAEAMLKAEFADRPLPLGCFWPAGTQHPLTERIAMLKTNPPSRLNRLVGGSVLTMLYGGLGVAAWAAQPAEVKFISSPAVSSAETLKAGKPVQLSQATPGSRQQTQATGASGEVEGNVIGQGFAYPNLQLHIRDAAGQDTVVTTEAPTPWDVFSGGIPVSVRVYTAQNGALYADLADFTSNGTKVVPQAVHQPNLVHTLETRAALCGTMPSAVELENDGDPTGRGWMADCSAKVTKAESTTKGEKGIPSIISNSVKREGISFSGPAKPSQSAVQHGWRDTAIDAAITLRSIDWTGERVLLNGVDDKTGQAWRLTSGSTNVMRRLGFQPDQMAAGLSLKVLIDPQGGPTRCARACSGVAREIQFPNGTKAFVGGPGDPRRTPAAFQEGPPAPTADELLRAAEADLQYFQRAARVGAASKSDVGAAAERLVRLQIASGRPPTARPLALESARQDLANARARYEAGLSPRSEISDAALRVQQLEALTNR